MRELCHPSARPKPWAAGLSDSGLCWGLSCLGGFAPGVKLRLERDPCCLILISAMLHVKNRVIGNFAQCCSTLPFHTAWVLLQPDHSVNSSADGDGAKGNSWSMCSTPLHNFDIDVSFL